MIVSQYYPIAGGLENQAKLLSESLASKANISVLTGNLGGRYIKKEKINDVNIYRYFARRIPIPFLSNYMKNSIGHWIGITIFLIRNRKKYDILHVHQMQDISFLICLISKFFKLPLIVKVANSGKRFDPLFFINHSKISRKFVLKTMINNIDYVISINKEIKKQLLELGFKKSKILEIPNGVKTDVMPYGGKSIKKFLKINKDDYLISFVGTLTKKKNVGKLLNAFSVIDFENLNVSLLVVGDGPERENLSQLSKDLCIDKKTHFLGYIENVNDVLYETDIFILPSLQEGLPNVILEAGAVGVFVICSNISGNNDIIDNKNGILFDLNSDKDLSDKIKYLLNDDKKRSEMALKLKKQVNNNYSIHKISEKYFDVYSNLIEN